MSSPLPSYQPRLTWWAHTWRTLLALLFSGVAFAAALATPPPIGIAREWMVAIDLVLGLIAWVAVFLRRRHPFPVALICTICAVASTLAVGPAFLALASLATWRRFLPLGIVGAVTVGGAALWSWLVLRDPGQDLVGVVISSILTTAIIAVIGLFVGSRRELMHTLRDRADRAEAEQRQREDRAREQERARIAREMHDVVAHRISQVSMRAGALAFRDDLPQAVVREHSGLIQQAANQALDELRGVLGVLRSPDGTVAQSPQPTFQQIPDLIRSEGDGRAVEFSDEVTAPVPDRLGRTLYRVVQEGLTNTGKHAPASHVKVSIAGAPGTGIELVISNPASVGARTSVPGSGLGLIGMAERVELLGGRLEHGWDAGRFRLRVWLPWTP